MKPWTETTGFKEWASALKKHRGKTKRQRPSNDMCRSKDFCKGSKDIPRSLMPQIYNAKRFSKTIRRKFKVGSKHTTMRARNLKPAQNEINADRVDDVVDAIEEKRLTRNPIVVSKDGYVVDGHHRWAAYKKKSPSKKIPVLKIDAPIKDALGIAVAAGTKREAF
jgi:hypothetical protein